ncbi:MAG: DUF4442 domain-containing protein [Acidiferrobacterales bacterium]|nr:DUF4442 domain-containing protein [Acidiferrobacterales bacterium]
MPSMLEQYNKIHRLPAGQFLFNKAIGLKAPFFGKIKPNVIEYREGLCRIEIKDRWGVRNHIGTINAGALCTLAEITGGMALDSTVAKSMRWIPKGMTVSYIKKATGTIAAVSQCDAALINSIEQAQDLVVKVTVANNQQETVFEANINFYISPKRNL